MGDLPYRGSIHHRYVYTMRNGALLAVPKLPFMETDSYFNGIGEKGRYRRLEDLALWWSGTFPFEVLNNGFVGPTVDEVIAQWRSVLGPDAVDDFAKALQ